MKPGWYIKPHRNDNDIKVVAHLGLRVSDYSKCILTVNEEKYFQKEGQFIIFDDSNLHSSINNSNTNRVVCYIKAR